MAAFQVHESGVVAEITSDERELEMTARSYGPQSDEWSTLRPQIDPDDVGSPVHSRVA